MDLNENIRIAAEQYNTKEGFCTGDNANSFIEGALSQQAKAYWYNEFKLQKESDDWNSKLESGNYTTFQKENDRRVTIVIHDINKVDGISDEIERAKQYQQYIDEHPDRPISFNNWKYMVDNYKYK